MTVVANEIVSVIVPHEGRLRDTVECIDGLAELDWPRELLEIVVVDVGSLRDDQRRLRRALPGAIVVSLDTDPGRAGALNRGVGAATGDFVAFLGSGCRPHPSWLRRSVAVLADDLSVASVAVRVKGGSARGEELAWPPAVSFVGHPVTVMARHDDEADDDDPRPGADHGPPFEVLFASLDAMVVRAETYRAVGGFDPAYDRSLEDVDLGWRLWLMGSRVVALPDVVVTRIRPDDNAEPTLYDRFLRERNALATIFKNYDDDTLAAALPSALSLSVRRGAILGGDELTPEIADRATSAVTRAPMSNPLAASAGAIDSFHRALPELQNARRALQRQRQRTDQEILRLLREPLTPDHPDSSYRDSFLTALDTLGARKRFGGRRRIVVGTCDTITAQMAGPAIRAWQIASALSLEHDVELVTTAEATVSHPRFRVRKVDDDDLRELEAWCDVLVFQGWFLTGRPFLLSSTKVVVADIYDPMHLEQLEQARDEGAKRRVELVHSAVDVLNEQLLRGDFFLCASPKQRDFWLGQLAALGRINPLTYDEDGTLESLVSVVPFGISDAPPVKTRPVVKGVIPGIGLDDKVILWGGGIYNWFDPLTLIKAVDRLRHRQPGVRLLFMGLRHPNPDIPEMRMAIKARKLAHDLGLTGTHVFFNEGWVEYEDRQNYLLEADVGVSTHITHLESAMSFRTRILDYLWASLPVVATKGDSLAALIESNNLGITVEGGNVEELEEALFRILDDEGFRKTCSENAVKVVPDLLWSRVLNPLVDFCRAPRRSRDLLDPEASNRMRRDLVQMKTGWRGWRHDLTSAVEYLEWGGPRLLVRKVTARLRRTLR